MSSRFYSGPPRVASAGHFPDKPTKRAAAGTLLVRWDSACAIAVLAAVAAAIFLTAPLQSDYWWSDTPRHALDGLFYLDLIRAMPLHDPKAWALAYYAQYPALTVGFYPPLGHLAFALGYALFGVGHGVAIGVVAVFFFALLCGVFAFARIAAAERAGSPWTASFAALTGAILVAASPQMLLWGQQAMLDIPALAWATWAAVFLLLYAGRGRPRELALFAAFAIGALYTKQTMALPLAGVAAGLLVTQGWGLLRRRHFWIIAAISVAALIPLVLLQLRFAAFNLVSVDSRPDLNGVPDRASLAGIAWYAAQAPVSFGWPLVGLALAGFGLRAIRRPALPMVLGWLIVAYVVLTLIALKEERHGLTLAVPLGVFASGAAALALERLAPRGQVPLVAGTMAVLASVGVFASVLAGGPTPTLTGYRQAAEEVMHAMPGGGRILFSGNRDAAFTVDVRFMDPGRRFTVVRVDKLFLHVAVQPGLGLHPRDLTAAEVSATLDRYGIQYVVSEPNLWLEAPVMRRFDAVLHSPQFQEVGRVPVRGPVGEKELVIYRNTHPLPAKPETDTPEIMGGFVSRGQ
jgi:MFS family permease